jgi:hypothetical protein
LAYLSPIGNSPIVDSNGAPLSGGSIYTYLAGTSTPAATYTTSDGDMQQDNPIPLNANGLPNSPIWLAPGVAMKLVIKDADDVPLSPTFDDILGVNDPSGVTAQDQWVQFTGTPTYIGATSFSVVGDQTGTLEVGRRLKTSNSGGTVYSTITASSFGAGITTVTVANDSGTLDSGLSAVSYGLLTVTNPSLPTPARVNAGTAEATTSGTAKDRTIPSWARRVTATLVGVSTSGTSVPLFQLGDSGGVETSGYSGVSFTANATPTFNSAQLSSGFLNPVGHLATVVYHGAITLTLQDPTTNTWAATWQFGSSASVFLAWGGGSKALTGTLTTLRLTTAGGADTFDAGSWNVTYE